MTQHTNFSPNIDRQTCCSTPRARMLETHAQRGHDTTSISSISRHAQASISSIRGGVCFSFVRPKSHLPERTEMRAKTSPFGNRVLPNSGPPPHPHPPLITPSSLCEVMNEAPSRGAFVIHHSVTLFPEVAGAVVGGEGGLTEAGIDPPNWACAAMPRPARTKPPSSRNP